MQNANASKKSDVDPKFQKLIQKLRTRSQTEFQTRKQNNQVKYEHPDPPVDPFDYDSYEDPFRREKANNDFVSATTSPNSPGTAGDLVATTIQIDYLSIAERAYRARLASGFPRMVAHQLARKKGHGDSKGPFTRGALEYVRGVLKQSSK